MSLLWDHGWIAFSSFPPISLIPSTTAGEANVSEVLIAAALSLKPDALKAPEHVNM